MNNLERFKKTMRFEDADHPPLALDGPWSDTWERWYREGYQKERGFRSLDFPWHGSCRSTV